MNARAAYGKPANAANGEIRNLANLGETASTSRVLNLAQISMTSSREEGYVSQPFFRNSTLNRALLIKHTLRTNERDLFAKPRRTVTKVILPFDANDLRLGGRSIFVNQIGFDSFARSYFNVENPNASLDVQLLRHLDDIPSLDPFLVREHLARFDFRPASCYLQISPRDLEEMVTFTNEEIRRLVLAACGEGMEVAAIKLTSKILANNLDADLEPLRQTFRMSTDEFAEGMFSWRGFLYFKWRQTALQADIGRVVKGLAEYRPLGPADEGTRDYLRSAPTRLSKQIITAILNTRRTLDIYDGAYKALIEGSDPAPFRKFLLEGPSMFFGLGECMGVLGHIGSFWSYRMGGKMKHLRLTPTEYADILVDFEDSLVNVEGVALDDW